MALAAATVWEVRTAGSDTNGGGFVIGTGVDHSQQDSAHATRTDIVIDAVTNTDITSAANAFAGDDVGNIINITSGTGFTVGRYEIISIPSGSIARLDRAVGTTGSTGGNGTDGGALATPGEAGGAHVSGNTVHIKSGTYTLTTATANVSGGIVSVVNGPNDGKHGRWEGYNTTRGDRGTKPVIDAGAQSSLVPMFNAGENNRVINIEVDGNNVASTRGWDQAEGEMIACVARDISVDGFGTGGAGTIKYRCEAINCGSGFAVGPTEHVVGCIARDCSGAGFKVGFEAHVSFCISHDNNIGFDDTSAAGKAYINCVSVGNTSHGYDLSTFNRGNIFLNCIAQNNGGWGWNIDNATDNAVYLINCAGDTNTSGDFDATKFAAENVENFVAYSADAFVDKATHNFALNNNAGGGADLRAAGFPGVFPGASSTGFLDIGAVQHQDPAVPVASKGILRPVFSDSYSEF